MVADSNDAAPRSRAGLWSRLSEHRAVSAVGSALLGAIVGVGVTWGWDAVRGATSIDDVMSEQQRSFAEIQDALSRLQSTSSPQELQSIAQDLRAQMNLQESLASRLQGNLASANRELRELRLQLLAAQSGYSGASEFWLKAGDSIRLPGDGNVLGLAQAWAIYADVVIANQTHRLTVGQELPFQADGRDCKAIFRQAIRGEDQRAGFDVACTPAAAAATAGG
jgi:hypothetical protein